MIRLDLNDRWEISTPRACIRGAVDARMGQTGDQFAHIDVHATTVANTGLSERRSVEGENRYALHRKVNLSMRQDIPV